MGLVLIDRAFEAALSHGLTGQQTRLLVYMALRARDPRSPQDQPRYFAHWKHSARALGLTVSDDATRAPSAVGKALHGLSAAGLIEREGGYSGRAAEYLLKLPAAAERSAETGDHSAAEGAPFERERSSVSEGKVRRNGGPIEGVQEPQGGHPPTRRTCTRHDTWEHDAPCRSCQRDRTAYEQANDRAAATRPPSTMSEAVTDCGPGNHRFLSDGTCMVCPVRREVAA